MVERRADAEGQRAEIGFELALDRLFRPGRSSTSSCFGAERGTAADRERLKIAVGPRRRLEAGPLEDLGDVVGGGLDPLGVPGARPSRASAARKVTSAFIRSSAGVSGVPTGRSGFGVSSPNEARTGPTSNSPAEHPAQENEPGRVAPTGAYHPRHGA